MKKFAARRISSIYKSIKSKILANLARIFYLIFAIYGEISLAQGANFTCEANFTRAEREFHCSLRELGSHAAISLSQSLPADW